MEKREPEMWQTTDMVTDQKSTFLQFSCIEKLISVLEDIVWFIDMLIEGRKSLDNFSHIPGVVFSWSKFGDFGVSWTDFMPKWNEHKAKPQSAFHDFSWPKIIIFSMVT